MNRRREVVIKTRIELFPENEGAFLFWGEGEDQRRICSNGLRYYFTLPPIRKVKALWLHLSPYHQTSEFAIKFWKQGIAGAIQWWWINEVHEDGHPGIAAVYYQLRDALLEFERLNPGQTVCYFSIEYVGK